MYFLRVKVPWNHIIQCKFFLNICPLMYVHPFVLEHWLCFWGKILFGIECMMVKSLRTDMRILGCCVHLPLTNRNQLLAHMWRNFNSNKVLRKCKRMVYIPLRKNSIICMYNICGVVKSPYARGMANKTAFYNDFDKLN